MTCMWEDEAEYNLSATPMGRLILLQENQGCPYALAQGVGGAALRLP